MDALALAEGLVLLAPVVQVLEQATVDLGAAGLRVLERQLIYLLVRHHDGTGLGLELCLPLSNGPDRWLVRTSVHHLGFFVIFLALIAVVADGGTFDVLWVR